MNIKRFFGKNSREALNLVRLALGEDAIIIANRSVDGGNEIMAVSDADMHAATHSPTSINKVIADQDTASFNAETMADAPYAQANNEYADAPTLLSILTQNKRAPQPLTIPEERSEVLIESKLDMPTASPEVSEAVMLEREFSRKLNLVLNEIRGMRSTVEPQINTITWNHSLQNNPTKHKTLSTLLAAKFSPELSRQIMESVPAKLDSTEANRWLKEALATKIDTIDNDSEILDEGGVFAIVGPTGVGKTTTTAKLAARYVMKHGTQNLGLITTDGYRIGGHEQLRIYGKILGVMVYAVKDEEDLKIALNELKSKHTILIDTVGVSQRDQMVTEQIAMLTNAQVNIKKLLCLNATSAGDTLTDVIRAYKGRALDGCIITKLDEAASIGNALDVIIREKIKLYYTTSGQRVPEDIALADKEDLISRALTLSSASWPFQYLDEELPFVVSDNPLSSLENDVETQHG